MRLRRGTFLLLHIVLFGAPWVTMNGHPLAQIDLPGRRVFLFGSVFTPSDTIFLALTLFFLAFSPLLLHLALRAGVVRVRVPADRLPRELDPAHRDLDRGRSSPAEAT